MNKNQLEHPKLSNRNTKSSLNFISNILIEPQGKLLKPKINYSKIIKPSFTRVANILCRNESKAFNLASSESAIKFQSSLTEILEKLRKVYEDYQLTPFMKVREDYIEKKQRFLSEQRARKESFDREIERLGLENKEINEKLKEFDGFGDRENGVEGSLVKVHRIGTKGELVKHLESFSFGADKLDRAVIDKKLDRVFHGMENIALDDLVCFLSFKVLQMVRKNDDKGKRSKEWKGNLEIMNKEESLIGFDTKTSLNSMYL